MKIVLSFFLIWYVIAYPISSIITISNVSTLGPVTWWHNNSYDNEFFQIILIFTISFFIHLFTFFLASSFLNLGMQTKFYDADKALFQLSNRLLLYPILIIICLGVLYSQYFNGWGVHGLPPFVENIGSGVGLTVLARDLLIPILFILAITNRRKYSYVNYGIYSALLFIFSILSLSKVTLVVWFAILIYISSKSKFSKSQYLISIIIFIISFILQTFSREYFYVQGDAINGQTIFSTLPDIINGLSALIEFSGHSSNNDYYIIMIQSMFERILGFRALASAVFYEGEYLWHSNYFYYFKNQVTYGHVTPLDLIGKSEVKGGFGIDYVSTLFITGPFAILFFVYVAIYFYCIGLLYKISSSYGIFIIFIGTLIAVRYLIDGNLSLFIGFSHLILFLVLTLYFLGLVCAKKKSFP